MYRSGSFLVIIYSFILFLYLLYLHSCFPEVFDLPFETKDVRMDRSGMENVNRAPGLYS